MERNLPRISLLCMLIFVCPSIFAQYGPSILWQKCLGGTGEDKANSIVRTVDNGFIIVGTSTSNNGDVSGHHGASNVTDAWVVKVSSTGTIEWQKSMGGSKEDMFMTVIATADGGYLCAGHTYSTDGDVVGNHGAKNIWLVKLDRFGTVAWQKCLGGSVGESFGNVKQNKDGSFYVIGSTSSNDGDVSGYHPYAYFTPSDVWVVRLSSNGSIIWNQCFGGTSTDDGYDICEAANNSFIIACNPSSTDGNLVPLSGNPNYCAVIKLDSNRKVVWSFYTQRNIPRQLYDAGNNVYYLISNPTNCYPTNPNYALKVEGFTDKGSSFGLPPTGSGSGYFSVCISATNPSFIGYPAGSWGFTRTSGGNNIMVATTNDTIHLTGYHGRAPDALVTNLTPLPYTKLFGGSGTDYATSVASINEFEFVACGYTNSNDGDVSGNHGGNDVWLVKFGRINQIRGTVFADYNLNNIKDINEPYLNSIIVKSQMGSFSTASSTYNGRFINYVDTGSYSTSVLTPLSYYTAVPVSTTSVFSSYNNYDSISFALQPIPGKRDYKIDLFRVSTIRPGFTGTFMVRYVNAGTDTLINKTVMLVADHRLRFLSALPAQSSIQGDTIKWTIASLAPRDTGTVTATFTVSAPPAVNVGDNLQVNALIDSTGDLKPADNFRTAKVTVVGSMDPNDKQESNDGVISKSDIDSGRNLTYTIRFQNTGTDTAFTVVIKDTLDTKLDWNTVEMVAASHPYRLTIINGNKLTWTMDNILLPDSNRNEPASHGFITYSVKPLANLVNGDIIHNNASIYFDFNLPVVTNTQLTSVKNVLQLPLVSGLQTSYCSSPGSYKGKITNLPDAASGIAVSVKSDAVVLAVSADSSFTFDTGSLTAGSHAITVTYSLGGDTQTYTYNFNVTVAATPDVSVSANITSIVNTTDAVTVTAINAAGGGSTPLYTFAKDRGFTNILQAEGSSNQYTVNTASLPMGDNWVYVRMKTSASCYTAQTNIDSIKLYKLLVPVQPIVTGLTSSYCGNQGIAKVKISNPPAAEYLATVSVVLDGTTVLTVTADSTVSINPSALSAGNHSVKTSYTNSSGFRADTSYFTITQAVTPDVNLSANITTVVNLTDNVIVTAANAAGGGSSPLYTFAKDKAMTNILQAEGTGNILTIAPATLNVGANWIYVRMKTSSACYAVQTNIDSIKIERSSVTGLVDVDNPGQVITVYPNPFKQGINISGLSTAKTYLITVSDASGKEVFRQQVSNSSNFVSNKHQFINGSYWLRIYDYKKKRLIGTSLLIRE